MTHFFFPKTKGEDKETKRNKIEAKFKLCRNSSRMKRSQSESRRWIHFSSGLTDVIKDLMHIWIGPAFIQPWFKDPPLKVTGGVGGDPSMHQVSGWSQTPRIWSQPSFNNLTKWAFLIFNRCTDFISCFWCFWICLLVIDTDSYSTIVALLFN